jgi:hypothetical protein
MTHDVRTAVYLPVCWELRRMALQLVALPGLLPARSKVRTAV